MGIWDARTASSMRPSAAKKRRKAWIMPRGGTWYILKHYIDKARTIGGWRKLYQMKDPSSNVVLIAAAKRMIPLIDVHKLEINPLSIRPRPDHFWVLLFRDNGKRVSIYCGYKFSIFHSGRQNIECSRPWKPLSAFNNCLSLHSTHSYIRRGKRTWYNHLDGRIGRLIK